MLISEVFYQRLKRIACVILAERKFLTKRGVI